MTTWVPAMGKALGRTLPLGNAAPPLDQNPGGARWRCRALCRVAGSRRSPDLLLAPARLIALASRYDPARYGRSAPRRVAGRGGAMAARDVRRMSWPELLATAREAMLFPETVVELRRRYLPRAVLALGGLRLLLGRLGLENRFGALLSGIDNKTLEANRALESLAAQIRADPALAVIFATHAPGEIGAPWNIRLRVGLSSPACAASSTPMATARPAHRCWSRNQRGRTRQRRCSAS